MEQKYKTIYNTLTKQLDDGIYKVGDLLPTENELCKVFNTSRMTVNKVISMLVTEGRVTRTRGKGTFVSNKIVEKEIIKLTSFTEDMLSMGKTPGSRLLEYTIMYDVPSKISDILNLEEDNYLHIIKRLRTADGEVVALDYNYISSKVIPDINITQAVGSFYSYIEKNLKIEIGYSNYEIKVITADKEIAKYLQIAIGDPVISLRHVTYTNDNRPFEYCVTHYRVDRYTFRSKAYR